MPEGGQGRHARTPSRQSPGRASPGSAGIVKETQQNAPDTPKRGAPKAADPGPKKVIIFAKHIGETFNVVLFPGTSDSALHRSAATRARVPVVNADGVESFYFTAGKPNDAVVPLCHNLPDGMKLNMHMNTARTAAASPTPPAAAAPAAPAATAPAAPAKLALDKFATKGAQDEATIKDEAASKVQAAQRGKIARKEMANRSPWDEVVTLVRRIFLPNSYERMRDNKGNDAEDAAVHGMAKMSRLATDMANERTLLAWLRTVLAVMRTAFSTIGLVGVGALWAAVHKAAVIMVVLLMCVSMYIGVYRYQKVSKIVKMKEVPNYFGRLPIWPVNAICGLAVGTIAIAIVANGIES